VLDKAARPVVECPGCRRLHVQESRVARTYKAYALEPESSESTR
jgi:hypothetical protein